MLDVGLIFFISSCFEDQIIEWGVEYILEARSSSAPGVRCSIRPEL